MKKITNAGTVRDGRGRMSITSTPGRKKSKPAVIAASYGKDGEVVLAHTPAPKK